MRSLRILAAGAFTAALLAGCSSAPGDDSTDAGFARDMSAHHAQAVDMALVILQTSQAEDIDTLAYDIATTQANQIGRMQELLVQWDLPLARSGEPMGWMADSDHHDSMPMDDAADPSSPDYAMMPGMATTAEMEQLSSATGTEAEVLFLQLMTTHHLAGVEMAEAALESAKDPEIQRLATSMVEGQQGEIDLMARMLAERGATAREDA